MIQLAHDVDFLSKLLETLFSFHEAEVETFYRVLDTSGFVGDEPNKAGDARTKDGTIMNAIIDFLDRFTEWYLDVSRARH